MIYTFYGYKGGVGRTLALVHAATILASSRLHTGIRVLVVDLDLEAPGSIETLLPPLNGEPAHAYGFSDLLQDYLKGNHETDWILEQIRKHAYVAGHSLYVFGSGSRERNGFLETSRLLPEAYESGFFDRFRQACDAYEYVLVDSRTGFADIATAATILIGDVLVACFRPNQANRGVGEMVRHFLARKHWSKESEEAHIIPVLTPRPAHYSAEVQKIAKQFKEEFFGTHPILQIPFDPILQVGEQLVVALGSAVICSEDGDIQLYPSANAYVDADAPVVAAYLALVDRLATFNTERDLVAAQRAEILAYADRRYGDALNYLFQIIRREPDQSRHWHKIVARYETYVRDDVALAARMHAFLDRCLDEDKSPITNSRGRAWAYGMRAYLSRNDSSSRINDDCADALRMSSEEDHELRGLVRFAQARSLQFARHGAEDDVILDHLNAAAELLGPSAAVYIAKGDALRKMHRDEEAASAYDMAIDLPDAPIEVLTSAAKAYEHVGKYGAALARYHAALGHGNDRDTFRRVAYLFASLECFDQAVATVYEWIHVRPNGLVDAYSTLINIRLAERNIDEAINVIDIMEKRLGLWVQHSLRVSLAIRQRLFEDAARVANEPNSDARPYLRVLAMLATGKKPPGPFDVAGSAEEVPPLTLAAVLAGSPHARARMNRAPEASSQPKKSRMIIAIAEALAAAADGSDRKIANIINETSADPEQAFYFSNQLELRLAHDVCDGAGEHIDRRMAAGMKRLFENWEAIKKEHPMPPFTPMKLKKDTGRGTQPLPLHSI